jgi:hypothetical protein
MLLNPEKCNYLMFSRSKEEFVTRLTVNGNKIDQKHTTKILGCWIDEDAGKWSTNTRELVKSAYSRMSMLTKLRYAGVSTEDLLDIYKLFIRSRAEYMSALWHGNLTLRQASKIENIQVTSLRIILKEMFVDYRMACEVTGLEQLATRRQARCLAFAKSCLKNKQTESMFPLNPDTQHNLREAEKYTINFAHTENYRNSAVPYCQRLLNQDHAARAERERARAPGAGPGAREGRSGEP